jgi:hypothetical protein
MAVQYALIALNGEIQHVVSPGCDSDYVEGNVYHGLTAIQVASDADGGELMQTKYYVDGAWQTRVARPSVWQDWSNNDWVFNTDRFWEHIRHERDMKLAACDWTQLSDVNFNAGVRQAWTAYRIALRNIPADNAGVVDVENINWPTKPE